MNLAGVGPDGAPADDVLGHRLRLAGGRAVEADHRGVPTGRVVPLTSGKYAPLNFAGGDRRLFVPGRRDRRVRDYDLTYDVASRTSLSRGDALLTDPTTGRAMSVATDAPGLHLDVGGLGKPLRRYAGAALSGRRFPDAPRRDFAHDGLLRPGETFTQTTTYRFPQP